MSGGALRVQTPVLGAIGTAFADVAAGLADIGADGPLGDAAGAVSRLETASACRAAQTQVAALLTAVTAAAQSYGENLRSAVSRYDARDAASAQAVERTV